MQTVNIWRISACTEHRSVINGPEYAGYNGRMPIPVIIATQCPHCVVMETGMGIKPEPESAPEPQGPGVLTQVEDVLILAEEALEPKTWIRRAAFGLMRLIRAKLR